MADTGDTIDPNDLDSIDALLDEAELEAVADSQDSEEESVGISAEEDPIDGIDGDEDDLLEGLESDLESVDLLDEEAAPAAEPAPVPELEPEPEPQLQPEPEPIAEVAEPQPTIAESRAEDILNKRAMAAQQNQTNSTGKEMDSIKKLLIIFSSTTIFLIIVAIGIGVWGVLSSSGSGLDEETLDMFESIQANTTQNLVQSDSASKLTQTFEKKLDAISFQIEQLNRDIVNAEPLISKADDKVEVNLAQEQAKVAKTQPIETKVVVTTPAAAEPPQAVVVNTSPELMQKMDKVSAQMVSAQRRINEVNRRVKSLQTQYKQLLKEIKSVEKELVSEQAASAKPSSPSQQVEAGHASDPNSAHEDGMMDEVDSGRTNQPGGAYEYRAPSTPLYSY